jgi:hypothetical protein
MKIVLFILGSIAILWIILTILAERKGAAKTIFIGELNSTRRALIVYNPDLFYNLDEQVCTSFALGLGDGGWGSKLATVTAAEEMIKDTFDLYVFCANTYNWKPDRPLTQYIINHPNLEKKNVAAITLGSGSTKKSQYLLEKHIKQKKGRLLDSKSYWLMKPNKEEPTKKSNVKIAVESARSFGKKIAEQLKNE